MEKYILEINAPNSSDDVIQTFESNSPFLVISKGDFLNTRTWENYPYEGKILRVLNIEHIIWEKEKQPKHKICIFTEEVEDNGAIRLN